MQSRLLGPEIWTLDPHLSPQSDGGARRGGGRRGEGGARMGNELSSCCEPQAALITLKPTSDDLNSVVSVAPAFAVSRHKDPRRPD